MEGKNQVVIVGAGAAGLITLFNLLKCGVKSVIVLEETDRVGGVWNLQPRSPSLQASLVKTSTQPIYVGLRTNLPKEIMAFSTDPFPSELEPYPLHFHVQCYLERFANKHNLVQYIHFGEFVQTCQYDHSANLWDVRTNNSLSMSCSHLIVCNGHFRRPYIPHSIQIKASTLEQAPMQLVHTSAYDSLQPWYGAHTVVIGASVSGSEIARLLLEKRQTHHVHLCVRKMTNRYRRLIQRIVHNSDDRLTVWENCRVSSIDTNKHQVVLDTREGEPVHLIDVASVIFATGYRYNVLDLLHPKEEYLGKLVPDEEEWHLRSLYKRVFYVHNPSLCFVGITNQTTSPFVVWEYQADLIAKVIAGRVSLPCMETMKLEIESRERMDSSQDRLGRLESGYYCNELCQLSRRRGFFTQLLVQRVPWMMQSWLVRHKTTTVLTLSTAMVVVITLVTRFK